MPQLSLKTTEMSFQKKIKEKMYSQSLQIQSLNQLGHGMQHHWIGTSSIEKKKHPISGWSWDQPKKKLKCWERTFRQERHLGHKC